jgi:Outer membrane protein beta-barrel domain
MKNTYKNSSFLILVLLAIQPFTSQAQIKLGVRAGLNASNISFDNLPDRRERFGFHAGIFSTFNIEPNFIDVQPELSYSLQGVAFKPSNTKIMLNMKYINLMVPLVFKLSTIDLQVGPFASYLVSSPDYAVYNENKIIYAAFNKIDAGLTAGIAYNRKNAMFGVRYNQGFVNVAKDNVKPYLGKGKNAVGQVSVGYKF